MARDIRSEQGHPLPIKFWGRHPPRHPTGDRVRKERAAPSFRTATPARRRTRQTGTGGEFSERTRHGDEGAVKRGPHRAQYSQPLLRSRQLQSKHPRDSTPQLRWDKARHPNARTRPAGGENQNKATMARGHGARTLMMTTAPLSAARRGGD